MDAPTVVIIDKKNFLKAEKERVMLIRLEKDAGYGIGRPTDMEIDYYADTFAFKLDHMTN